MSGQSGDHNTAASVNSSPMAAQSPSLPPSSSSPTITTNIYPPPTSEPVSSESLLAASEPTSSEPVSSSNQSQSQAGFRRFTRPRRPNPRKIMQRDMEGIEHISVSVNGIDMHVAQAGQGPVVLFLHGFPECWYTWRHQMCFLASQGYRAVAPDLRGYGETTGAPNDDPSKFTSLHVVGDLVALISAVAAEDEEKVFVVGHDWGAMMAWALCLYRPDKVKALVNMSVCFTPRNPKAKPLQTLRAVYGDDYYICRFQDFEQEMVRLGRLILYSPHCLPVTQS
nr:bifunctional epoxide hydrolase 2-like [Ipomoea batatas]